MVKPRLRSMGVLASVDQGNTVGPDPFHSHVGTAHDGASLTAHDIAGWRPPRRSADAEIIPEWSTLVGRTRDFDRNNPIAKGAKQTIVDNVVGTGPMLLSMPDWQTLGQTEDWALEWGESFERLFHPWWCSTACHAGDTLNGAQMVAQAEAQKITNGDSLVLPLWLPDRADGYATKLQLIETDRLTNPNGQPDTPFLRRGVAQDVYGMPLGYHVQKAHPGDYALWGYPNLVYEWEYIPRRTEFGRLRAIHYLDQDRPGQSRGKPLLTTLIPILKQCDRYARAEVDAAVNNAMIAGILTTPLSREDIVELFSKDPRGWLSARDEHAIKLQSGSLMTTFPGDDLKPFIPGRPNPQFGAFVKNMLMIASVALDMPYELVAKDWSQTTYTSGRMALLEAYRAFNRRRSNSEIGLLNPIVELFAEEQFYAGNLDAPGFDDPIKRRAYLQCDWIFPGRGWVDQVKEAVGAATRLANNITTLAKECAEQGLYWRDVLRQRAVEKAFCEKLGLPFVAATTVRVSSVEAPDNAGDTGPAGDSAGNSGSDAGNSNRERASVTETVEVALNA